MFRKSLLTIIAVLPCCVATTAIADAVDLKTHKPDFKWKTGPNGQQWIYDGQLPVGQFFVGYSDKKPMRDIARPISLHNLRLMPGGPLLIAKGESCGPLCLSWRKHLIFYMQIDELKVDQKNPARFKLYIKSHDVGLRKDQPDHASYRPNNVVEETWLEVTFDPALPSYVYDVRTKLTVQPGREEAMIARDFRGLEYGDILPAGCNAPLNKKLYRDYVYKGRDGTFYRLPHDLNKGPEKRGILYGNNGSMAFLLEKQGNPVVELLGETAANSFSEICHAMYDVHFKFSKEKGTKLLKAGKPLEAHFRVYSLREDVAKKMLDQSVWDPKLNLPCDKRRTGSDWTKPFAPDEHTVVLYHFDEGKGNEARDALGDADLTLRAHKTALWGSRAGFGTTARFARGADDADLRVGPTNNDKLHLKTCTEAWTVEAWIRYTGPGGQEHGGRTYASICSTDDEGFGLREGTRGGFGFMLILGRGGVGKLKDGLLPTARFMGSPRGKDPNHDTSAHLFPRYWANKIKGRHIADSKWHHVAWQFRYKDQLNTFFLDGKLLTKISLPVTRAPKRIIVNDTENTCVPFVVGGWIHSQDPPFYIRSGNFKGEIDELRISQIMRYPVARKLAIVRQKLPKAGLKIPYSVELATDAARGKVVWKLLAGKLPKGLALDKKRSAIAGRPLETVVDRTVTIGATDAAGHTDKHTFSLTVVRGRLVTKSLPPAFADSPYRVALKTTDMAKPMRWQVVSGTLPQGITLNGATGQLQGTPAKKGSTRLAIQVTDANGLRDCCDLVLRVLPQELRAIKADANTVVLYDWQGPSGKLFTDVMGDKELTLTMTNMGGDRRVSWPGREGRFPQDTGHGEHGWITKVKANPKLDLKTCKHEWTVEAWVRRGGPIQAYGDKVDKTHQPFDYGHICGTYDNSKRGVWELYLSDHDSPDGSMAAGVHFLGAEPDQALMDLHPWKRPKGIVGNPQEVGILDTEWHHVAWQYSYAEDLHQLFLDGKLIWQMKSPDGRKLVNNRRHEAQFSVSTRLTGYARYGGGFNFLGFGNFFGQIGEIRISNMRRY